mmetsp:Transcript_68328/g.123141  ORF Transcript_68328/g.123141 Transcript_68328/m.123141 type:complete len:525 (-) Transcript_68328:105-1679(-)
MVAATGLHPIRWCVVFIFALLPKLPSSLAGHPSRHETFSAHPNLTYNFSEPRWVSDAANYTVTISPNVTGRALWEGWGTSLCWWAHVFGQREDLADAIFTEKLVKLQGEVLPGLGLNIARYNAGASSSRAVHNQTMQLSKKMPAFREMPGFWLDWASEDPSSDSWNWSVDVNQVAMLQKAVARGAVATLFSNSPMWWQCANHNPCGSALGIADNLQPWNHRQHAHYLASVAEHAARSWGVRFASVEPFNEPSSVWWESEVGTQEGCHFQHSSQQSLVLLLRQALDQVGLEDVLVAASDENTYTGALDTWRSFNASVRWSVGRVNVHGYEGKSGRRDLLRQEVGETPLWNSEYGDGDASGFSMATNMHLDFWWLKPSAWVYWQALDFSDGWGLLTADQATSLPGGPNLKYYVLAQYTRHVRPGMQLLDSGDLNTLAAYSSELQKLALVTINYGTEQWITYNLTGFAAFKGGPVAWWRTDAQGRERYIRQPDALLGDDGLLAVHLAAFTVQSFELSTRTPAATLVV